LPSPGGTCVVLMIDVLLPRSVSDHTSPPRPLERIVAAHVAGTL
jgi:hypothetical protein